MASVENGEPKFANDDYACAFGVRVLAGRRMVGAGYLGGTLGAADLPRLRDILRDALGRAHRRAAASGEAKAAAREKLSGLGTSLADTRLAPVRVARETVPAVYRVDPRTMPLETMVRTATELGREIRALDPRLTYSHLATVTELSRELFCSSEGALIDQSFALTQGMAYVVGTTAESSQELYDVVGHQRGWEILTDGVHDGFMELPDFRTFALDLAREAVELAAAPPLPSTDGDVVVVTDPHYNALVAHEIVGHPSELDRGLKMEMAYAGRSWLLGDLGDTQVGRPIASPLVSAYSDPALPGLRPLRVRPRRHARPPGRPHRPRGLPRVPEQPADRGHLRRGAERPLQGGRRVSRPADPDVEHGVRRGDRRPRQILRDVERGYYLVAHRIPSIAESRENFRISARRVYEIRNGELGRLYRDGGITADTRDYLMNVDAVGTDFRLYPIPNCGKGQPMQTKRLGNGGPTMRSRARLTGGS